MPSKQARGHLSFADRVAYQRAIEEVYWRHRIWPKERSGSKPPLEKIMSQAQIEQKVEAYVRDSELLDQYWHRPITPGQLQAAMDRMARDSTQPEVLHEIFQALGNDAFVVAECLARPALAERLVTQLGSGNVEEMKQMGSNDAVLESTVVEYFAAGDRGGS